MQNDIPINNLQSLFQLFTAIYLIAEWVNIDGIFEHYKNRHKKEFQYRIKITKKYSKDLHELFEGYENDAWLPFSTDKPMKNSRKIKMLCLFFSFISFVGLIVSSMNTGWTLSPISFMLTVLFLLIPFGIVIFMIIIPLERTYKWVKDSINNMLKEIEVEIEKYKLENPEPPFWFNFDANQDGDKIIQFKRHREIRKTYFSELDKYMKDRFK